MIIGIEAAHANKDKLTGVERVCLELITHLKEEILAPGQVRLYSNTSLNTSFGTLPGNWQSRVLFWPFKKLWSQFRLSWELFFNPPDIFIAPGQLIPFFCPKNTITIVHDSAFLVYPLVYNFWGRQYLKWMNRRIVKKSRLIITPSEFSKQELLKNYKITPEKVVVIPLGYNAKVYHQLSLEESNKILEFLSACGINKPFLLSINRLEEKKNTKRIIEAFNILKKDFDLQLILVGKPRVGFAEIERALECSPFKKDIKVLGWVEEDKLPGLLSAAQVLMVPSLYEGFGLPLLNAMAVGCPVVASLGNALGEVAGEAAVYVNAQDSQDIARGAREFLADQEKRNISIQLGLKRVMNYSWKKFAQLVYKEAVKLQEEP